MKKAKLSDTVNVDISISSDVQRRGPCNREEFFEVLKAFYVLTGREAVKMILPAATRKELRRMVELPMNIPVNRLGGVDLATGPKFCLE